VFARVLGRGAAWLIERLADAGYQKLIARVRGSDRRWQAPAGAPIVVGYRAVSSLG
jgi:hypothetical protein